jgi:lysophospholipase L1-like esterase
MKPSPSRKDLLDRYNEANKKIRLFLARQKNTSFIDVYHKMFDSKARIFTNLFQPDSLHMNAQGYATWKKEIKPYLLKN